MAKMYLKSDLKFVDGYLIDKDDNVVALPAEVSKQINDLETRIQKLQYLDDQPEAQPQRSLDGFVRKTTRDVPVIMVDTPTIDDKVDEGKKILEEIRDLDKAIKVNEILTDFSEAFGWFHSERFVEGVDVVRIDTPMIGDILEADADELIDDIISYLD